MSNWYVVRTQVCAEERAAWHLNNQGFETYLPLYRKTVRHARKTQAVKRPLFPGYLFVCFDDQTQGWRAINGTVGVMSVVQFGGRPQPIDPAIVADIHDREDDEGLVTVAVDELKQGDVVRVREGAFVDCTAILEEVSDQKRVFLLLDIMGREVRTSMNRGNLAKVS